MCSVIFNFPKLLYLWLKFSINGPFFESLGRDTASMRSNKYCTPFHAKTWFASSRHTLELNNIYICIRNLKYITLCMSAFVCMYQEHILMNWVWRGNQICQIFYNSCEKKLVKRFTKDGYTVHALIHQLNCRVNIRENRNTTDRYPAAPFHLFCRHDQVPRTWGWALCIWLLLLCSTLCKHNGKVWWHYMCDCNWKISCKLQCMLKLCRFRQS